MAAGNGHTEIVKLLADNANASDVDGETPIFRAAFHGHLEVVKFLIPLADNPNAPNNHGITPSSVTRTEEIRRILET